MSSTEQSADVKAFLHKLDAALADVPIATAREVRQGIAEELTNLPPDQVRERIQQLGDPMVIAADVRAEAGRARFGRGRRSRAYIIGASLTVALGGIVLPVVGWIVGYVLVCISPAWRRWEKAIMLITPISITLLVAVFLTITGVGSRVGDTILLPVSSVVIWNTLVTLTLTNLAVGLFLLARALRKPAQDG